MWHFMKIRTSYPTGLTAAVANLKKKKNWESGAGAKYVTKPQLTYYYFLPTATTPQISQTFQST